MIKQLDTSLKGLAENPQRLWDDLYIIANFHLDVNNPFPVPEPEVLLKTHGWPSARKSLQALRKEYRAPGKRSDELETAEREEASFTGQVDEDVYAMEQGRRWMTRDHKRYSTAVAGKLT